MGLMQRLPLHMGQRRASGIGAVCAHLLGARTNISCILHARLLTLGRPYWSLALVPLPFEKERAGVTIND